MKLNKLNIKLEKFLCCVLLSFMMAFCNISAVFDDAPYKINQNQVYAAIPGYYSDYIKIKNIYLDSLVDLTGNIYYTYYQYANGAKIFYSIDDVDTWLTGITIGSSWIQDYYEYYFSADYRVAYVRIYGWFDGDYIFEDYILNF